MIFSELYNEYYNTVARILSEAVDGSLDEKRINEIVREQAFGESFMTIIPALKEQRWQLLNPDYSTPLRNKPTMPLTDLQKRWLKAISLDKRVKLFDLDFSGLEDVEPLFTDEDYIVYDKYGDGDNYEDGNYIKNFRLVLDSIRNGYPLTVTVTNRHGRRLTKNIIAGSLEYSEKDDKFRVITRDTGRMTLNLGRITSCEKYTGSRVRVDKSRKSNKKCLVFDVTNERNALERAMLHFAHFEKETRRTGDNTYRVTLYYDWDDETELVIRILSFGPKIKVIEPENFINLIKDRLKRQKSCGL